MDFTKMTMEELCQMKTEIYNEIDRRNKIEEEQAMKNFIDAFIKLVHLGVNVSYEDYEDTYALINPEKFHFDSL